MTAEPGAPIGNVPAHGLLEESEFVRTLLVEVTELPDTFLLLLALGKRELRRNRPEEALFYLNRATNGSKDEVDLWQVWLLQALAHASLGEMADAVEDGLSALLERPALSEHLLPALSEWLTPPVAVQVQGHPLWRRFPWAGANASGSHADLSAQDLVGLSLLQCKMHMYCGQYDLAQATYAWIQTNAEINALPQLQAKYLSREAIQSTDTEDRLPLAQLCRLWDPETARAIAERELMRDKDDLLAEQRHDLHRLVGELREELGERDAWWHFYCTGRLSLELGNPMQALGFLEHALALAEGESTEAPCYWYIMECQRVLSFEPSPSAAHDGLTAMPSINAMRVQAALRAWKQGTAIVAPANDPWGSRWAYYARALLCEQLERLQLPGSEVAKGEALGYVLLGLIFTGQGAAQRWATAARYYRELDLRENAQACAARAFELDPGLPEALEEHLSSFCARGRLTTALEVLEANRHNYALESDWLQGQHAKVQLLKDPHHVPEALAWFEATLRSRPAELEWRFWRALCHARTGNWTEACHDWEQLSTSCAPTDPTTLKFRPWTDLYLGLAKWDPNRLRTALAGFADLRMQPEHEFMAQLGQAMSTVGASSQKELTDLSEGAAYDWLDLGVREPPTCMARTVAIQLHLPVARVLVGRAPLAELRQGALSRLARAVAEATPWQGSSQPDCELELTRRLAGLGPEEAHLRTALRLGIVQTHLERRAFESAATATQDVALGSSYPAEVAALLPRVIELALSAGDNAWRQGALAEAADFWQQALAMEQHCHHPSLRVRALSRLAVIGLIDGDSVRSALLSQVFQLCYEVGLDRTWVRNAIGGLFVAPFLPEPFSALLRGLGRYAAGPLASAMLAEDCRWLIEELTARLPVPSQS